ncbi:MAG: helix-turn-helix domain-containing protein [Desulfuromonadaceae bacterium]|nr:helix-turn-helix domain-containing protein [Desulfuromonadaceae bacterium]MDD2856730.1 helix-turn-helix domain-containing protein [Desulfuromonadaceae bacterium]
MARQKVPTDPAERKAWIKYQLEINGSSFADLARATGNSRQTVRKALDIKYPKWDRAIAAKIGMTPSEIWPERYAA